MAIEPYIEDMDKCVHKMKRSEFKVLLIYPNTMMATLLPLNICTLSACLKHAGFDVRLFDTTYYPTEKVNFEQKKVGLLQLKPFDLSSYGILQKKTDMLDDLRSIVEEYRPHLVGITLVEDTYALGVRLLKTVRGHTDVPIIAGGVCANFAAEELIREDFVDTVCVGEGEETIVELCTRMANGEDYTDVGNLLVKKGGMVHRNAMRPPTSLDDLPFIDYDVFEPSRLGRPMHGKVRRMVHVELDRGCPYNCTYCEAPAIAKLYREQCGCKYYRQKSPARIIAEMKFLKEKYNPDYINFNSESFLAASQDRLRELAQMYKRDVGLPFWCQSRPETVTSEKLAIIKDMECADLQYGIEHGNEEFRRRVLKRQSSNERILEACRLTEEAGIPYTVNNIIGFPDETRDLVWDTIRFNRQINPKTMNCYFFTPYRGTALYHYCIEHGLLDPKSRTRQLLDGGDIKYKFVTREELYGLQRTFSLYARFDEEWFPKIRVAEFFDEDGNRMFEELSAEYRRRFFA